MTEPDNDPGDRGRPAGPSLPGDPGSPAEPSLDMVTAALRADSADLAIYVRVLT